MVDVVIRCEVCRGRGERYSMVGRGSTGAHLELEQCSNCVGSGLELIEAEFTEDEVAA